MFEVGTPPYPLCQILAVCPSWTNLLSIYHILTAFSYDVALSRGKPVVSMSMTIPILSIIPSNRKENWCQRYYTLWEQDTPFSILLSTRQYHCIFYSVDNLSFDAYVHWSHGTCPFPSLQVCLHIISYSR